MAISSKQLRILQYLADKPEITLQKAVELIGGNIYHNAPKYVGETLARMVKERLLVRVSKGVYAKSPECSTGPTVGQLHIGKKLGSGAVMPGMEEWARKRGLIE